MDKKGKKSYVSTHNQKKEPAHLNNQTKEPVTPIVSETPAINDQIKLTTEEVTKITSAEQAKLQARINLADLEVYLAELKDKKVELLSQVRTKSDEFMAVVREAAVANGIDPDGKKDESRWNLDTNTMVFHRVK
jgi:hypothetical protein